MISILNYGMGNLGSIRNMLRKVGASSGVVTTSREIQEAGALIIPGVGHFDNAMRQIAAMGLNQALDEAALSRRIPILGICLGMQIMTGSSEEGQLPGLGWVPAQTRRIDGAGHNLRVPHMGWNKITVLKSNPYFPENAGEQRFYFVHSYAIHCDEPADILATTQYAGCFVSAFSVGNLTGVQFHPEKSHRFGASFLRHYAAAHDLLDRP